eukprot:CAMPEP_0172858410 /NCGR_PEP_ID=MMETSP1075-20121228/66693_1 /TAXON_ID=2916 /ORGANISM="Ceratium fusus, Strain PA161109" /LENGTH=99 /DNA_ID=CAMNT_0013705955 /DNA_START=146 /DNA_END=443 /DNA_ORIENTATION=-
MGEERAKKPATKKVLSLKQCASWLSASCGQAGTTGMVILSTSQLVYGQRWQARMACLSSGEDEGGSPAEPRWEGEAEDAVEAKGRWRCSATVGGSSSGG